MGRLFIAVLVLVVLEGALRKWVSPSLTTPLVLIRDFLALCAILWAAKMRTLSLSRPGAQALLVWAIVVVVWGGVQAIVSEGSPVVLVVGVRYWLLYLAFAYAAGVTLTSRDVRWVMRVLTILIIAIAPLAVVQHFLEPTATLNKQADEGATQVFLATSGVVRTTGTFTFTAGYTVFLALVTPCVLASLGPGAWREKRRWLAIASLLALGTATIVSGSRGAIIMFAMLLATYALASLVLSRATTRASSTLRIAAVGALLLVCVYLLPTAVAATEARFNEAAQSEVVSERIASIFLGSTASIYSSVPLLGQGIGAGSNFAGVAETGSRAFMLGETEIARTLQEGGFLGAVFAVLKLIVIVVGVRQALRVTRATGSPLPILLWVTTGVALLSWAMIGQLTVNAVGYLLLGLAIASLRLAPRSR